MLVIMTFNVQYFASIVAGVFVAHFSTNLIACREKPFEESNSNSKRGKKYFFFENGASNITRLGFITISSGSRSSTITSSTLYLSFQSREWIVERSQ